MTWTVDARVHGVGRDAAGSSKRSANAGVAITTFTQAQVTAGDIQFVHDGGEAAPAYSVTVSDGALLGRTAGGDDHVHEPERRVRRSGTML